MKKEGRGTTKIHSDIKATNCKKATNTHQPHQKKKKKKDSDLLEMEP